VLGQDYDKGRTQIIINYRVYRFIYEKPTIIFATGHLFSIRINSGQPQKTITIRSQYGVSPCATTRVWGSIPPPPPPI
jgi:hypothetical protein